MKTIVLALVGFLSNRICMPMMNWAAAGRFEPSKPTPQFDGYMLPTSSVNVLVMLAAFEDRITAFEKDPEGEQALLNACMECVRNERIHSATLNMFGHLMTSGYPPQECMIRIQANAVALGIAVQKRLEKVY